MDDAVRANPPDPKPQQRHHDKIHCGRSSPVHVRETTSSRRTPDFALDSCASSFNLRLLYHRILACLVVYWAWRTVSMVYQQSRVWYGWLAVCHHPSRVAWAATCFDNYILKAPIALTSFVANMLVSNGQTVVGARCPIESTPLSVLFLFTLVIDVTKPNLLGVVPDRPLTASRRALIISAESSVMTGGSSGGRITHSFLSSIPPLAAVAASTLLLAFVTRLILCQPPFWIQVQAKCGKITVALIAPDHTSSSERDRIPVPVQEIVEPEGDRERGVKMSPSETPVMVPQQDASLLEAPPDAKCSMEDGGSEKKETGNEADTDSCSTPRASAGPANDPPFGLLIEQMTLLADRLKALNEGGRHSHSAPNLCSPSTNNEPSLSPTCLDTPPEASLTSSPLFTHLPKPVSVHMLSPLKDKERRCRSKKPKRVAKEKTDSVSPGSAAGPPTTTDANAMALVPVSKPNLYEVTFPKALWPWALDGFQIPVEPPSKKRRDTEQDLVVIYSTPVPSHIRLISLQVEDNTLAEQPQAGTCISPFSTGSDLGSPITPKADPTSLACSPRFFKLNDVNGVLDAALSTCTRQMNIFEQPASIGGQPRSTNRGVATATSLPSHGETVKAEALFEQSTRNHVLPVPRIVPPPPYSPTPTAPGLTMNQRSPAPSCSFTFNAPFPTASDSKIAMCVGGTGPAFGATLVTPNLRQDCTPVFRDYSSPYIAANPFSRTYENTHTTTAQQTCTKPTIQPLYLSQERGGYGYPVTSQVDTNCCPPLLQPQPIVPPFNAPCGPSAPQYWTGANIMIQNGISQRPPPSGTQPAQYHNHPHHPHRLIHPLPNGYWAKRPITGEFVPSMHPPGRFYSYPNANVPSRPRAASMSASMQTSSNGQHLPSIPTSTSSTIYETPLPCRPPKRELPVSGTSNPMMLSALLGPNYPMNTTKDHPLTLPASYSSGPLRTATVQPGPAMKPTFVGCLFESSSFSENNTPGYFKSSIWAYDPTSTNTTVGSTLVQDFNNLDPDVSSTDSRSYIPTIPIDNADVYMHSNQVSRHATNHPNPSTNYWYSSTSAYNNEGASAHRSGINAAGDDDGIDAEPPSDDEIPSDSSNVSELLREAVSHSQTHPTY